MTWIPVSSVKPSSTDWGTYSDHAKRFSSSAVAAGGSAAARPARAPSATSVRRVKRILRSSFPVWGVQGFLRRSASVRKTASTVIPMKTVEIAFSDGSSPFFTRPKISSGSVRVPALAVK